MTITEMRVISTEMKTDMVLRLTQMTVVWEDTRWEQHLFSIRWWVAVQLCSKMASTKTCSSTWCNTWAWILRLYRTWSILMTPRVSSSSTGSKTWRISSCNIKIQCIKIAAASLLPPPVHLSRLSMLSTRTHLSHNSKPSQTKWTAVKWCHRLCNRCRLWCNRQLLCCRKVITTQTTSSTTMSCQKARWVSVSS